MMLDFDERTAVFDRRRTSPKEERGFTIVEMLVVMTIVGVLAGVAVTSIRVDTVGDAARQVSSLMQEARRRAIAGGAVRADVAAATGITARCQIEFLTVDSVNLVRIWELVEDTSPATTASWSMLSQHELGKDVEIYAVGSTAESLGGQAVPEPLGTGAIAKQFFPNATSDAMTVYLRDRYKPDTDRKYRIWAHPLSGIPATGKYW